MLLELKKNKQTNKKNKRLVNVCEGVDSDDVITKNQMEVGLSTKPHTSDLMLLDGSQHMKGDLNMDNYRIYNLANPQNDIDAVAKLYVDWSFHKKDENIDLLEKYNVTNLNNNHLLI